jgi:hypothetical protein
VDALNIAYNLVGEDTVSEERFREAYEKNIVFIVDKDAISRSSLSVDFEGARNVYTPSEYSRVQRGESIARIRADEEQSRIQAEKARAAAKQRAREAAERERAKQEAKAASEAAYQKNVAQECEASRSSAKYRTDARTTVSRLSTAEMHLFSVVTCAGGVEIECEHGAICLYADEMEQLRQGKSLGVNHSLTKMLDSIDTGAFVLYSGEHPELENEALAKADDVAFLLQRGYPKYKIYRDPFSEKTQNQVKRLNGFKIQSKDDLVTLIADDSFEATDWRIIQNILPDLKKRGFENNLVVRKGNVSKWRGGSGKSVTVITGHIDANLVAFIHELGKAGYFQDNIVLLNTCRERATRGLATSIGSDYGAVGVFCYDDKIKAADVEDFVLAVADAVKNNPDKPFVNVINENLGPHRLNGVWTLCEEVDARARTFVCYVSQTQRHN